MDTVDRIFELVDLQYKDQKDFAKALNIDPSHVSRWRKRKTASYRKLIAEIAIVLNTTVEYLLNGTSPLISGNAEKLSYEEQQLIVAWRKADKKSQSLVRIALDLHESAPPTSGKKVI